MIEKEKKVTVIVPVYNTEKQLERCVASIRKQTYTNLEILLVDDGSTDHSPDLCDQQAEEEERIRVIHKENGGVSSARNKGLEEATGEFVVFVDSDDWVEEQMISNMVELAEDYQVPLVVCDHIRAGEKRENTDGKTEQLFSSEQALEKYLAEDKTIRIPHSVWGKLFSRSLIGSRRFPLIKRTEELLFSTEIFCEMKQCVYIPQTFYHYCDDREDSLMHNADAAHTVETEIPLLVEQVRTIEQAGYIKAAQLAWFCLGKRLMYIYLAFRDKMLKQEAIAVKRYAKQNRKHILESLHGEYVKKTDRLRISMFLICPKLYYRFVLMHDR